MISISSMAILMIHRVERSDEKSNEVGEDRYGLRNMSNKTDTMYSLRPTIASAYT